LAVAITSIFFVGCEKEKYINDAGNLVPKTVDQDQSLSSISVNGTQFHTETFGNPDSAMVVFLHGGPGADYRNGLAVKQLADNGYYVVFYDQRGSGLSKRHDKGSFTIQQMFDDLSAVIQYYRKSPTQKIFLFGHSWGAILAAGYINQNPSLISGAIFAEPGGFTWENLQKYGERTRKLELFAEATSDALYLDQFITGKENEHEILDYKLNVSSSFTYQKGNAEGIEGPSPMWRNGAIVLTSLSDIASKDGYDFTTNLNQYNTKVLFLYGELNTAYGLEFAEMEAQYFPTTQITQIDDTGHEMIYFKWGNVYPVALTYFNSLK
jgi:proline iminopeptidase